MSACNVILHNQLQQKANKSDNKESISKACIFCLIIGFQSPQFEVLTIVNTQY
jgi:hypothetical protein